MNYKKAIKMSAAALCLSASLVMLAGCGEEEDVVDQACDAVVEMASQKDATQEALDNFHSDADAKESEADAILEGVLE